jgi:hypothetical protein
MLAQGADLLPDGRLDRGRDTTIRLPARAQVRVHGAAAMFKLYILNRAEAFFGFYPIAEHTVSLHGEPVPMYDLMGKDATMFHHEQGDDSSGTGGQFRPGAGLVRQHVGHRQPQPPMTARTLRQIIGGTRHLLLDFDGPICSVYARTTA